MYRSIKPNLASGGETPEEGLGDGPQIVWVQEGLGALRAAPTHTPQLPHFPRVQAIGCPCALLSGPVLIHCCSYLPVDVGSVEGLAYHRGWDTLYWTSYTTSTITRHTVDQTRPGAFERETVITMSGDDHPRAFVLDECQK